MVGPPPPPTPNADTVTPTPTPRTTSVAASALNIPPPTRRPTNRRPWEGHDLHHACRVRWVELAGVVGLLVIAKYVLRLVVQFDKLAGAVFVGEELVDVLVVTVCLSVCVSAID